LLVESETKNKLDGIIRRCSQKPISHITVPNYSRVLPINTRKSLSNYNEHIIQNRKITLIQQEKDKPQESSKRETKFKYIEAENEKLFNKLIPKKVRIAFESEENKRTIIEKDVKHLNTQKDTQGLSIPIRAFKLSETNLNNVDNTIEMMRQRAYKYSGRAKKCKNNYFEAKTSFTKDSIIPSQSEKIEEEFERKKLDDVSYRQRGFTQRNNSEIVFANKKNYKNTSHRINCENCLLLLAKRLSSADCHCHRNLF